MTEHQVSAAQETVEATGRTLLPDEWLIAAVMEGNSFAAKRCLEDGVEVNIQDGEGMTALHHAAAMGARPCIRLLVEWGKCDYLIKDDYGRYASDLASEWGRDAAVARLLRKKQRQLAAKRGVPAWTPPEKAVRRPGNKTIR